VGELQNPPGGRPGAAIPSPHVLANRLDELERSIQNLEKARAATLQAQPGRKLRRVLQLLPLDFRLDMRLKPRKTTGTLEARFLAQISSLTATPIRVQSDDLGEARIPPHPRDRVSWPTKQPAREVLAGAC